MTTPDHAGMSPHPSMGRIRWIAAIGVTIAAVALAIVWYRHERAKAGRRAVAAAQIYQLAIAVLNFDIAHDRVPTEAELAGMMTDANPWPIDDPWGHPYVYIVAPDAPDGFDLVSYGADGRPGGADDDDVSYRELSAHPAR